MIAEPRRALALARRAATGLLVFVGVACNALLDLDYTFGSDATTGSSGSGSGTGGGAGNPCVLHGELTEDRELDPEVCESYDLDGTLVIAEGARLSLLPGTDVIARAGSAVVVVQGGSISAVGEADAPIVIRSNGTSGGAWNGVAVLGRAPASGAPIVDVAGSAYDFGGDADDDSSGALIYVRIEGARDGAGLFLGGVGSGTDLHHVQVRDAARCFEIAGGSIAAHHLACQAPSEEGIAWRGGFSGSIQHAVVQAPRGGGERGVRGRNNTCEDAGERDRCAAASEHALARPRSSPTIANLTVCGFAGAGASGVRAEAGTLGAFAHAIVAANAVGLEHEPAPTALDVRTTRFGGNDVVAEGDALGVVEAPGSGNVVEPRTPVPGCALASFAPRDAPTLAALDVPDLEPTTYAGACEAAPCWADADGGEAWLDWTLRPAQ